MQTPPDGPHPADAITGSELRRDVSVWGSYMWGYAAVGADIYTALGIITLAALGLAPLASPGCGCSSRWPALFCSYGSTFGESRSPRISTRSSGPSPFLRKV